MGAAKSSDSERVQIGPLYTTIKKRGTRCANSCPFLVLGLDLSARCVLFGAIDERERAQMCIAAESASGGSDE